mmetsp:Transcript_10765/g.44768  ORF Transcript_10765/g.44768 Transcript_10765/m.44768 type:complete len:378 (+) Transcript_10765:989-2122(+)
MRRGVFGPCRTPRGFIWQTGFVGSEATGRSPPEGEKGVVDGLLQGIEGLLEVVSRDVHGHLAAPLRARASPLIPKADGSFIGPVRIIFLSTFERVVTRRALPTVAPSAERVAAGSVRGEARKEPRGRRRRWRKRPRRRRCSRVATNSPWTRTSNPSSSLSRRPSAPRRTARSAAAASTNPSRRPPRSSRDSSTPRTRCSNAANPSRGAPRGSRPPSATRSARSSAMHPRWTPRRARCTPRWTTWTRGYRTSPRRARALARVCAEPQRTGRRRNARGRRRCTWRCSTLAGTTGSWTTTTTRSTWTSTTPTTISTTTTRAAGARLRLVSGSTEARTSSPAFSRIQNETRRLPGSRSRCSSSRVSTSGRRTIAPGSPNRR